ncbi:MAG: hypothetical protein HY516_03395 [Candidatus Aenigmarchaeota archaeon]|nr:hypothetical protein [Candidatus Aenigmarchaeota archaeon]
MTEAYLNRKLSRREFLGYAAKGAASLAAATTLGQLLAACAPDEPTTPVKRGYTISDVRAGFVRPDIYVTETTAAMPEIRDKKQKGVLAGILYNPAGSDIEQITAGIFEGRGYAPDVIKDASVLAMEAYKDSKNNYQHAVATVVPGLNLLFGTRVPMYLVFHESFADYVETDEEFRMHTRHELRHVEDFYSGIILGSRLITGTQPDITPEFIENIGELRAMHDTSMAMFRAFTAEGVLPVSPNVFGSEMGRYADYWKNLTTGGTATERMLADLQLAEFSDMIPEDLGISETKITFVLEGKKQSLVVKRVE